jgi:ankyrin repeat protein
MRNVYGLVKLLFKFGCNEYLKDNYQRTPLHYAAMKSSNTIVRYLIERNTFIDYKSSESAELTKEFLNAQDVYGRTALHYACKHNQTDNAVTIINSEMASLNFMDYNSQTALEIVYENENWILFEKLIKYEVHVSARLMREICAKNNTRLVKAIVRELDMNSFDLDENGNSVLYWAVKYSNNTETVRILIESSLRFNERDFTELVDDLKQLEMSSQNRDLHETSSMKALYYIEILILMLKNRFFTSGYCLKYLVQTLNSILICTNQASPNQSSKYFHRLSYMLALAIYSKQLVIESIDNESYKVLIENASKLDLKELIFDSTLSPWSLQMATRVVVTNHYDLRKTLPIHLPDICMKYLNFEYI